eukprot:TRINITY_DN68027_c8_g1_i1.p1 TRINITY_DN68027_c8_g1~~TRINITY_DN68027_c8_g1_i1.p1  ORF type:complete len:467 (-),score=55.63 TRINITY_DN68027_c8_g1_i1:617-2017(-)
MKSFVGVLLLCFFGLASADTPANCTYEKMRGQWTLYVGKGGGDNTLNCTGFTKADAIRTYNVSLDFPDHAADSAGNTGFWTIIYNQGWAMVIGNYKYFAYAKYERVSKKKVISMCGETRPGWVHDVNERDWACYVGHKRTMEKPTEHEETNKLDGPAGEKHFKNDHKFIHAINKAQHSWKATAYPHLEEYTMAEMGRHIGVRRVGKMPSPAPITSEQEQAVKSLPKAFDWRNVGGRNFVTPVRNQAACGSCYDFSSCAMMESRWRIATNNTATVIFSPQDVLNCGNYSQGCAGGFPYLIGKYGQDFGLVDEKCAPYQGKDGKCHRPRNSHCGPKYFTKSYHYVGGFFGACNEALMRLELVKNGPLAVSFQVYKDLINYKGGVYHHVTEEQLDEVSKIHHYNPWEKTDHSVLIVGYGVEKGQPYWAVKNSWGTKWGVKGYFKILRGVDECSIESMAVGAEPGNISME